MSQSPSTILATSRMGRFQLFAIFICVVLNALDGFDVLSISFASPGIANEWQIDRAQLGIVLSMELIGMAIGSVLLGNVADKIGRRPMILGSLIVMTAGMYAVTLSQSPFDLSVYRFITGLGIGGMLASINAMAAEYSNKKFRTLAVTIMAAGYPIGAVIGGTVASELLQTHDWRSVFIFGTIVTACCIPLVYFFLPESIEYLNERRPAGALEKINKTLKKMGHGTVTALPEKEKKNESSSIGMLFSGKLAQITIILTAAYFMTIVTFYFILKWTPKIVVDMGNPASVAGQVLVWASIGGATGAIVFGLLTQKFNTRKLTILSLLIAFVMVAWFGQEHDSITTLKAMVATAGFFANAAIVGLYALFVDYFPTKVRASGTGFVIGVGRGGAALSPIAAGYMFAAGMSLSTVAIIMAVCSLFAAAFLFIIRPAPSETTNG